MAVTVRGGDRLDAKGFNVNCVIAGRDKEFLNAARAVSDSVGLTSGLAWLDCGGFDSHPANSIRQASAVTAALYLAR